MKKISLTVKCCYVFAIGMLLCFSFRGAAQLHIIDIKSAAALKDFFTYTEDRIPFISSHRGGPLKDYPENCIKTFNNTLLHTWSLIEMDPHYTKDSALVVMHDPTLDRTSNGHGKISAHTLNELMQLRLKDTEGNLTNERMPTFDEVLEWAKGKTILMIDAKDVPIEVRVQKVKEHHAENNAMIMAYSLEDAKKCYALDKNIMMEAVFMHDKKTVDEFDTSGVPWENVVVFVTHTAPKEADIFDYIHAKGAMCIRGSSRTIDKDFTKGIIKDTVVLYEKYRALINDGADIIEADLGIEAGYGIAPLQKMTGLKKQYFKIVK